MRRLALLVLILILLPYPASVSAAEPAAWVDVIDGVPVWVTIVPRERAITPGDRAARPWWEWADPTRDLLIFAFNTPEDVRLIVDFSTRPNGLPEARVFVNERGGAPIDYVLDGDRLLVRSHNGHPYIRIRAEEGGWTVNGRTNFNLSLAIDGHLEGFGDPNAQTDGKVDVEARTQGSPAGVFESAVYRLVRDPYPRQFYPRFYASQRMANAPPFKLTPGLMPGFPYLGIGTRNDGWFRENPNPLYFNLERSELVLNFFPGLQTGGTYAINSPTRPPDVSFEAPYVYYSFDPSTRFPQLIVRSDYAPANSPFTAARTNYRPYTSFRYCWKTDDEQRWKYALHVSGPFSYTQQLEIGAEEFVGIPPDELTDWIVAQPWPMATFVESVDGYPGLESIYFYSTQTTSIWPWLYGFSEEQPDYLATPFLQESSTELGNTSIMALPVGFRGEYHAAYFSQPRLYFSPLDNRVHLYAAQGGIWHLGSGYVLRSHNLGQGPYINGWTRERPLAPVPESNQQPRAWPGPAEEGLFALAGHLLYLGPDGVELRRTSYVYATLDLTPPKDPASWTTFREQVRPFVGQERDPWNLRGWLEAFPGAALSVAGARARDVRAVEGGFRFVLELEPGYQASGVDLLPLRGLQPGSYVITYDGTFEVEPLVPAAVELSVQVPAGARALTEPTELQVNAANRGGEDAGDLSLVGTISRDGGAPLEIFRRSLSLPAGEQRPALLTWWPPDAGDWQLSVVVEDADGRIIAEEAQTVTVAATPQYAIPAIFDLSTGLDHRWPSFILLAGIAICIGLATILAGGLTRRKDQL